LTFFTPAITIKLERKNNPLHQIYPIQFTKEAVMNFPALYRKRLIPDECILLKDDIIISCDENVILTKWNTLKPKKDLHHGYSCYLLNEGIKVSKFYREDNSLIYWYCDIVDYQFNEDKSALVATDLLADVLIYPDGFVKVLDLDELADACEMGMISGELLQESLRTTNRLLETIYQGNFGKYMQYINEAEE
jgi:protein associated with RNAse G/E